jgi:sarcosine dehydrogenase
MKRLPALEKAGIKQMINGPESFTPDGNFILGSAPRMREHVRRRRFQRLRDCGRRRRRLGSGAMGSSTARRRSISGSSTSGGFPRCIAIGDGSMTGRSRPMASIMKSAFRILNTRAVGHASSRHLYERLKSHRAVFGSKLGWERPNWFAPDGMEAVRHPFDGAPELV